MSRHTLARRLFPWLLLLAAGAWSLGATAQDMQIIELRHRSASELLPIVQPLVEQGGAITGTDNLLIVRTGASNLAQIRQAVAALDRAPRQLLISVRQGSPATEDAADVQGSATVGSGGADARVEVSARSLHTNAGQLGSVRTLEGSEAWIALGQSRPVTSETVTTGGYGTTVTQSTTYRDTRSGFYATARLSGDRVTLEISPQQQAFRSRGSIDTQALVTRVSGRLGEWIPLGAVRRQAGDTTNGLLVWSTRSADSEYAAWVKVDEIP